MQSVMDEVLYLRGAEENRLVLRKALKTARIAPSAPTSQELQRKLALSEEVIGTMAKELCFRSEALAAIFRCTSELGKTNAVEELSYRLLADLLQIVAADWFILRLAPKNEPLRLVFVKSSRPGLTLEPISLDADPSYAARCAELRAAVSRKDVFFGPQNPLAPD